jgi:radical SAM superfamily enzyme YgiQ (UPF0313 family)
MKVLLVSTYELGHQPLHVASPAAALQLAGHEVRGLDLSVDDWDPSIAGWAEAVAVSVPMHTAMRLAVRVASTLRAGRPDLPICFYGLYATLNQQLTGGLVDRVIAGQYETALVDWVAGLTAGRVAPPGARGVSVELGRTIARRPARQLLPPLERYARLAVGEELRTAGYVEASQGCSHRCRHCPVPVIYDGRVRMVDPQAVLVDVGQQVAMGARHITFGDPDFLNAPQHARRVVAMVHDAFGDLTFDCTVKVEHVLRHAGLWSEFADAGCLFVISAFESVDDSVLARLDKGHTAVQASEAVTLLRQSGIEVRPSFLPFTPWTTLASLVDLLDFVIAHDLVDNVDPVQFTIRLLLPEGSLLLELPDIEPSLRGYDQERLGWTWVAADPRLDELQDRLAGLVEEAAAAGIPNDEVFSAITTAVRDAAAAAGEPSGSGRWAGGMTSAPGRPGPRAHLTEPWFCCSEPTRQQLASLTD